MLECLGPTAFLSSRDHRRTCPENVAQVGNGLDPVADLVARKDRHVGPGVVRLQEPPEQHAPEGTNRCPPSLMTGRGRSLSHSWTDWVLTVFTFSIIAAQVSLASLSCPVIAASAPMEIPQTTTSPGRSSSRLVCAGLPSLLSPSVQQHMDPGPNLYSLSTRMVPRIGSPWPTGSSSTFMQPIFTARLVNEGGANVECRDEAWSLPWVGGYRRVQMHLSYPMSEPDFDPALAKEFVDGRDHNVAHASVGLPQDGTPISEEGTGKPA